MRVPDLKTFAAAFILLAVLPAPPVFAQAQRRQPPLQEIDSKLQFGESIQVTQFSGERFDGRFGGIYGTSLILLSDGPAQEIPETAIRQVKARRADSLWNGALIGLGIGAGITAGMVIVLSDEEVQRRDKLGVAMTAAIGAGAGAFIDRLFKGYSSVFEMPRISTRFTITKERKAFGLSVSF